MTIKLDENIPYSLADDLSALGPRSDHVKDEEFTGHSDKIIWETAQKEERFFIALDLDFSDIREHPPEKHAGILLVRLRVPGRKALRNRILQVFKSESVESREENFVLLTDIKLRVHENLPGE